MPVAEVKEYDMKVVKEAREAFESSMQQRSVARGDPTSGAPAFGWLEDAPDGDGFVGSYGRVFDVTVLGRPGSGTRSPRMITLEASLFESGRPALIAPPTPPQRIGENILIAWNRSTEQSRTTAFAMPLLRKANRVTVVTVEGGTIIGPPGEQLVRYLRLNGIQAKNINVNVGNRDSGEAILSKAQSLGCDLLIKGAYTQSRLRQMIFGGATRYQLANTTIPMLMAH
jgi:nucleotide-binding universal stress UspA family protein